MKPAHFVLLVLLAVCSGSFLVAESAAVGSQVLTPIANFELKSIDDLGQLPPIKEKYGRIIIVRAWPHNWTRSEQRGVALNGVYMGDLPGKTLMVIDAPRDVYVVSIVGADPYVLVHPDSPAMAGFVSWDGSVAPIIDMRLGNRVTYLGIRADSRKGVGVISEQQARKLTESGYKVQYRVFVPPSANREGLYAELIQAAEPILRKAISVVSPDDTPRQPQDEVRLLKSGVPLAGEFDVLGVVMDVTAQKQAFEAPNLFQDVAELLGIYRGASHIIGLNRLVGASREVYYGLIASRKTAASELVLHSNSPIILSINKPEFVGASLPDAACVQLCKTAALICLTAGYYPLLPAASEDTSALKAGFKADCDLSWRVVDCTSKNEKICTIIDASGANVFPEAVGRARLDKLIGPDFSAKKVLLPGMEVIFDEGTLYTAHAISSLKGEMGDMKEEAAGIAFGKTADDAKKQALLDALGKLKTKGEPLNLCRLFYRHLEDGGIPKALLSAGPIDTIPVPTSVSREQTLLALRTVFDGRWQIHISEGSDNLLLAEYYESGWYLNAYILLSDGTIKIYHCATLNGHAATKNDWIEKICLKLRQSLAKDQKR